MKHIQPFDLFINEKKDEKYTARIEDSRKPGGSDKDIKKDYGLDVENRDRDGFDIVGKKEDIEAFIEDYGMGSEVEIEVYESAEATNEGKTIGTLSDEDDDLYLEAKELLAKEYEKFLKTVEPKLMKIISKASKDNVLKTNLQSKAANDLVDVYKIGFLK
jgi:hypothetical protein